MVSSVVCVSEQAAPIAVLERTILHSTDTEGVEYFNNLTVKETSDSFWVFQMTCTAENQTAFAREFTVWATSIG